MDLSRPSPLAGEGNVSMRARETGREHIWLSLGPRPRSLRVALHPSPFRCSAAPSLSRKGRGGKRFTCNCFAAPSKHSNSSRRTSELWRYDLYMPLKWPRAPLGARQIDFRYWGAISFPTAPRKLPSGPQSELAVLRLDGYAEPCLCGGTAHSGGGGFDLAPPNTNFQ
ncbi:MAG: hypothetical protein RLZZ366_1133 [Pseudomonadota bacterium]